MIFLIFRTGKKKHFNFEHVLKKKWKSVIRIVLSNSFTCHLTDKYNTNIARLFQPVLSIIFEIQILLLTLHHLKSIGLKMVQIKQWPRTSAVFFHKFWIQIGIHVTSGNYAW